MMETGAILPAETDTAALEGNQAGVRDGDAMGVAGEVLQNLEWAAEGRLGVDHPFHSSQRGE